MCNTMDFDFFIGKTISEITKHKVMGNEINELRFKVGDDIYKMYNDDDQSSCECSVWLEDVCGDLDDLLNTPILRAYEATKKDDSKRDGWDESASWTFYNFSTIKGSVTLRWIGSSNGFYSEKMEIEKCY